VNDNNGTMYNGSCLDFDGTDDFVSIADDSTLDITGDMTVSCWVALDSAMNNNLGILVNKRDAGDYTTPFLIYFEDRSGQDSFKFVMGEGSSSENIGSDDNFNGVYGKWDHVVATIFGTTMSIYVNGVLDTTGTFSGSRQTNNIPIRVGASYTNGSYDYPTTGQMADVRVYSAALSAANVKEIYDDSKVIIPTKNDASGGFVSQTNLKCWLPMVDGLGDYAYDGSGNNNIGTLTNMTSADWLTGQTGAPQLVQGYNRPMLFSNPQYVEVPQDSALDVGTSDFTVSAWIWPKTGSQTNMFMQFAGAGGWRLLGGASDKTRFTVFDNGWSNYAFMDVTPALTRNQWSHFAVSVDRGGNAQSYINGVAKSYVSVSGVTGTLTNAYPLRFGAGSYTNGAPTGDYMDGVMNEAIIYIGTALNAADIAALAATGPNGGPLPPDPTTMTYSTTSYSSSYLKGYWSYSSSYLKGYWRNDGLPKVVGVGSEVWIDRSGNGNDGVVNGSPSELLFKQGYTGSKNVNTGRDNQGFPLKFKNVGAIGFNGSSDYIQPDQSLSGPLVSTTGTLDFWVNFTDLDGYRGLYYLYDNAYSDYFILRGSGGSSLTLLAELSNSSILNHTTSLQYHIGQWINLVYTQDGTTIRIYVNGVEIDSVASTVWTGHLSATPVCKIGYSVWASSYLNGALAGVRVYNRPLTYAEIQQNYNAFKSRFGE